MRKAFAWLSALALLLGLCACTGTQTGAESSAAQSAVVSEPEPEPENIYIQYPGFVDQYFDSEDHVLLLPNSKDNPVSFRFELTDRKGEVLFQSGDVAPGEDTGWDVSEHWKQNEHRLTITSTPVFEDGTLGNPASQTITVTVELDQ